MSGIDKKGSDHGFKGDRNSFVLLATVSDGKCFENVVQDGAQKMIVAAVT